MEQTHLRRRSCMAKFVGGAHGPSRLVICEVERTSSSLKRFSVWAYCGYPDEVLDISGSLSGEGGRASC